MARTIEEVLAYRSDLSTFLVHLTRRTKTLSALEVLKQIITDWMLREGSPQGPASQRLRTAGLSDANQRVVCFTESPLEHVKLLVEPITSRNCEFSCYGVAITKKQGRRLGANPIWYLDATPGHTWLTQDVDALVAAAIANPQNTALQSVFKLSPFFDHMGTWGNSRKEFWWEREWRIQGDLDLPLRIVIFCPEEDFDEVTAHLKANERHKFSVILDPRWSLERMLAHLAGFDPADASSP